MLDSHTAVGQMAPVASQHAREAAQAHLTTLLRVKAHESGWPHEVVQGLHVAHTEDGFQVGIHDSIQDKAMDLEYGTQSQAPSGLLRQFHNRMHDHADVAVGNSLLETAHRMGVI